MHWSKKLPKAACAGALEWARTQPSAAVAWRNCKRGEWMLWLLGYLGGPAGGKRRKRLALCACDCAATGRKYTSGEFRKAFDRSQRITRAWARGSATLDEVREAAVGHAAGAAYQESAAWTAAEAANDAAGWAAAGTIRGHWAARGTNWNAYDAALHAALARCANIVRKHYPTPPRLVRAK